MGTNGFQQMHNPVDKRNHPMTSRRFRLVRSALALLSVGLFASACSEIDDPSLSQESSFLTQLTVSSATSSTSNGSNTPDKAKDGSMTSRWESVQGTGADPSWITLDLGTSQSISEIKLSWETACGKDFTLSVSDNNTSWTTVKTVTGNTVLTNDYTGLTASGR